ncbi:hypothetical protein [Homoserinimonas hongtaonis]|uniref:Uncharacterized protein n=1 Tax=Homoserinimonas hongtaonis TaxID=2079791 RepID=A0A2U1T1S4_9MICO|nr:hypothetical protein [Salinibacterium hongtaonis]PWB97816.1 hypothetical protein DF220_08215 [Salinibacterium hongtaonis]
MSERRRDPTAQLSGFGAEAGQAAADNPGVHRHLGDLAGSPFVIRQDAQIDQEVHDVIFA